MKRVLTSILAASLLHGQLSFGLMSVAVATAIHCFTSSSLYAALDKSGVSPSALSLPTGPGSIDGLGESFEAQLNTGTFTYSIPIELPKVRGGASPSLAISYNSGNGNGPLGMGWKLDVPRVQRQTDKGLPQYTKDDSIIDSSGEELVKLADGGYRSENEGKSVRFEWQADDSWLARMPDGSQMVLGGTANARLAGPRGTYAWCVSSVTDTNGNRSRYTYRQEGGDGQMYLASVIVGEHETLPSETFTAVFGYEAGRLDPILDFRPGFRSETKLRLSDITIAHGARPLVRYKVTYDPTACVSLLESVKLFGDQRSVTDAAAQVNRDFLPPHRFEYSHVTFAQNWSLVSVPNAPGASFAANQMEFADVNGDALPDLVIYDPGDAVYRTALNRGQGRPWGIVQTVTNSPIAPLNAAGTQFADLRGDGKTRLLTQDDANFTFRTFSSPTRFSAPIGFDTLGFFFNTPNVKFIDINNDKAMDLMHATGNDNHFGFLINRQASNQVNQVITTASPNSSIAFDAGWQLIDVNGDRLTDLVYPATSTEGGCVFHYSKGWGIFDTQKSIADGPAEHELGPRDKAGLTAIDVNQDGWADCVYIDSGLVKVWINEGGTRYANAVVIAHASIPEYEEGITGIRFADMNGNGSTDIVWNRTDGNAAQRLQYLELSPGTKPHLLIAAINELGGSIGVEYKSSVDYMVAVDGTPQQWTTLSPISIPVVSALVENDGRSHDYRSEITYRNAYYDGVEKEFRGFEFATRKELGDSVQGVPTLATDMAFYTGNPLAVPPEHESFKGKPRSMEQRDEATGAIFSRITHRWVPRQLALTLDAAETRSVTLAYEDFEETTILEKGPAAQAIVLQREFNVDDYGNTISTADYGRVEGANRSAWDDERITITTYSASYPSGLNAWLLDAPIQTEVQDENGTVIARSQNFYDDPTFAGANLGTVTKGNLTLERRWHDIAGNRYLSASRSVFDGYGNVQGIYDPLGTPADLTTGHYRSFVYDAKIHTYPETEVVHTGNAVQPTLTATATYDVGLGVLKTFTDFNTHTTDLLYDTFGRLTDMIRPGDTLAAPTASYTYQLSQSHGSGILNYIESRRRETAGGGTIDSRDYFDGLGRKLQSRSESEQGSSAVVTGATEFNQRKSAWKSCLPYFSAGGLEFAPIPATTAFTETAYDATGRALRTYQPLDPQTGIRAFAETTYEPLALLLKDEEQTKAASPHFGAASRQIFDGLKSSEGKPRLREVQEIVKISDTGDVTASPATWQTRYGYDLLDNLVHITDSQNNVKTLVFDALSRMSGMDDPDAGLLALEYDDASNLHQSTDANGHVIVYSCDGANRPLTEDYLDAANLSPDVRYTYDVPTAALDQGDGTTATAENTKGRLASVQDLSGEEHLSYDARGRTVSEVKRLPDPELGLLVSYRTQSIFDSADRMQRLIYPDGDYVEYRYNARSLLEKITGGPAGFLISSIAYRASGQEDTVSYGNGVTTLRDYDPRLRLSSLKTNAPANARAYLDYSYQLDDASNITRIEDRRSLAGQTDAAARQNTQSFLYDDLYRLTQSAWPSARAGQPGQIDYKYDRIGNMLRQTSDLAHADRGKPVANLGLMTTGGNLGAWGRAGRGTSPAGPHALTTVIPVAAPAGPATRSYAYDKKGSMTQIDGLTCGYDFKDRLTTAENDDMRAAYLYDHTDRRVRKTVIPKSNPTTLNPQLSSTTTYLNRYFEFRDADSPVKYVWQGSNRLARASGTLAADIQPLQWIRLRPGWNLISATTTAASRSQLLSDARLTAIVYWDASASAWKNFHTAATPPEAFVAWIHATAPAILSVRGPPCTVPATLPAQSQFLPVLGREAIALASTFPSSTELWSWNSAIPRWDVRPPAAAAALFAHLSPTKAAPNTALYLATTAGGNLTLNLPPPAFTLRYYHGDHLGTISVTTDASGDLVEESTSYPFGHPRNEYQPHGTNEPYGFTQKELDEESGLHYFEARYLVATVGRFNRVDPLYLLSPSRRAGMPQSLNCFGYSANRPTIFVDPSGMEFWGMDGYEWTSLGVGGLPVAGSLQSVVELVSGKDYITGEDTSRLLAAGGIFAGILPGGKVILKGLVKGGSKHLDDVAEIGTKIESKAVASSEKVHVTYTKTGPNGELYSGRSSGSSHMTPEEIVAKRDAGHHMNKKGFGPSVLDKSSTNSAAIRGREQQLIDAHGGARSKGGKSGNAINGIGAKNSKAAHYKSEATKLFGGK